MAKNLITREIVTKSSSCYSIKVKKASSRWTCSGKQNKRYFAQHFSMSCFGAVWWNIFVPLFNLSPFRRWQGYNEAKLRQIHYYAFFQQNKEVACWHTKWRIVSTGWHITVILDRTMGHYLRSPSAGPLLPQIDIILGLFNWKEIAEMHGRLFGIQAEFIVLR